MRSQWIGVVKSLYRVVSRNLCTSRGVTCCEDDVVAYIAAPVHAMPLVGLYKMRRREVSMYHNYINSVVSVVHVSRARVCTTLFRTKVKFVDIFNVFVFLCSPNSSQPDERTTVHD